MYIENGSKTLDILFYKKEIEIKKTKKLFGHFDPMQKCSVFSFVQYSFTYHSAPSAKGSPSYH